ncbi:hypothetical protein IG193_06715 [Infirmifilum lucidum]|uniref:Uncharacterized protein n=1 Tax=Infirmifilum lucidum TaxID=2776706 RepID=A0A7L9FGL0_9CREN|nr:MarR family transcriptional regulator [Infirmifilum lucidum]QOJ78442.1 hypothetical protein IG193_06715 [Infirmifilum lucidum]
MPEITCPKCSRKFNVEISQERILLARKNPLRTAAILIPHEDHEAIVFVDAEGHVVRVEWSSAPAKGIVNSLLEVPVPASKAPEPKNLDTLEWLILAMCDGRRSLQEICEALGITLGTGRLVVERLRSRGYIEKVITKLRVS